AAKSREREIKNSVRRRSKWLSRKWRTSARGNPFLNTNGFNIVLYKHGSSWSGIITDRETGEELRAQRRYSTLDKAKLAAFDAMTFIKQRR
ncbi:MAG: hypothetical protein RLN70_01065, partial [Rhodospirillaceae bacterium]